MGLLPDTQNCWLRMSRECRERFPRHQLQRKPLVSDPGMHHGTCVTHVPWCVSGSLTRDGGKNVPGILGACATRNFAYVVRGPCTDPISIHYVPIIVFTYQLHVLFFGITYLQESWLNLLRPSNTMCQHRTKSTLTRARTCYMYLGAQSHYQNQC